MKGSQDAKGRYLTQGEIHQAINVLKNSGKENEIKKILQVRRDNSSRMMNRVSSTIETEVADGFEKYCTIDLNDSR